jgi:hypothetical protein
LPENWRKSAPAFEAGRGFKTVPPLAESQLAFFVSRSGRLLTVIAQPHQMICQMRSVKCAVISRVKTITLWGENQKLLASFSPFFPDSD